MAAAEGLAVLALITTVAAPARAQSNVDQYQFLRRQHNGGGFFGLFGDWGSQPSRRYRPQPKVTHHVDYWRAPPPRKQETPPDPNKPITTIVVMGGSMADWLAYGLEDAFSDSPNVEIVRKDQPRSGLLRYKYKSDLDWWHVARDDLAHQKANFVVMMLGVTDRQNIRESDAAKEAEQEAQKNAQSQPNGSGTPKPGQANEAKSKSKVAHVKGVLTFRSDRWEKVYGRRIDKTIAALKSRGVPVFWVGLPSIRGTKSTADAVYLNNLYRTHAERAGVVYIDVWDGFVDDAGKYTSFGPDYEGQTRRLRSRDGVFFTKYGARKLAHYVEREIRRYMTNHITTLNFPTGPIGPVPGAGKSAARPAVGPVVPLTAITGNADVLLGGAGAQPARVDATATGVLVKGDALKAPPGRADDFKWPADSEAYGKPPAATKPAAGPAKTGAATAVSSRQTQGSVPAAAARMTPAPSVGQPAEAEKAAADAARAKVEVEAEAKAAAEAKRQAEAKAQEEARIKAQRKAKEKAQAEARRRAAERARAQARQGLRPPGRIESRQRPRRPPPRSDDPFRDLFGLLPH